MEFNSGKSGKTVKDDLSKTEMILIGKQEGLQHSIPHPTAKKMILCNISLMSKKQIKRNDENSHESICHTEIKETEQHYQTTMHPFSTFCFPFPSFMSHIFFYHIQFYFLVNSYRIWFNP